VVLVFAVDGREMDGEMIDPHRSQQSHDQRASDDDDHTLDFSFFRSQLKHGGGWQSLSATSMSNYIELSLSSWAHC
jgi:hypothetical protein